jgi:hypothetical protein
MELSDEISAIFAVTNDEEKAIRDGIKSQLLIQAPLQVLVNG